MQDRIAPGHRLDAGKELIHGFAVTALHDFGTGGEGNARCRPLRPGCAVRKALRRRPTAASQPLEQLTAHGRGPEAAVAAFTAACAPPRRSGRTWAKRHGSTKSICVTYL